MSSHDPPPSSCPSIGSSRAHDEHGRLVLNTNRTLPDGINLLVQAAIGTNAKDPLEASFSVAVSHVEDGAMMLFTKNGIHHAEDAATMRTDLERITTAYANIYVAKFRAAMAVS